MYLQNNFACYYRYRLFEIDGGVLIPIVINPSFDLKQVEDIADSPELVFALDSISDLHQAVDPLVEALNCDGKLHFA